MEHRRCIIELLRIANALTERACTDAFHGLNIGHCQAQILRRLRHAPASMSSLSRALCCHKSNITQVIEHLVDGACIERMASPHDRRMVMLRLTPKGRAMCTRVERALSAQAAASMSVFSSSDQTRFEDLLTRYIAHHNTSASPTKGSPSRRAGTPTPPAERSTMSGSPS